MFSVVIDPGHGGENKGAEYGGLKEEDLTLKVAFKVHALCNQNSPDISCALTRLDNSTKTWPERNQVALDSNADLVVSIHFNASKEVTMQGVECYRHPDNHCCDPLIREFLWHTPTQLTTNRGQVFTTSAKGWKKNAHAVVSAFSAPCVLLECGYLTNLRDLAFIKKPFALDMIALAVYAGILEQAQEAVK